MSLAFPAFMSGLILDTVSRGRLEAKLLRYLRRTPIRRRSVLALFGRALSQQVALHLPGSRLGQLIDKHDPARILDRHQRRLRRAASARRPARRWAALAVLEHDVRLRLDEFLGILPADDRRFEHAGMPDERRLDLDRRDPLAADLEHVVGAAAVPEVAVGILVILVAGLDPVSRRWWPWCARACSSTASRCCRPRSAGCRSRPAARAGRLRPPDSA